MEVKVTKHAKGLFGVSVAFTLHQVGNESYRPFNNMLRYPEHRDLAKEVGLKLSHGDEATFTFKTNLETWEIIVDIFSDYKYYDLTGMNEVLKQIKLIEGDK
tara:strand:- start:726 stop:1031 length:306 start_codon:yes stop_codon:yes gene_type:complete